MNKKNLSSVDIALVAARLGSKGIKRKNFIKFKKNYIVDNAVKIGISIKSIYKTILSSDSLDILNLTKNNKKVFKILRSKHISRDITPMLPVMKDTIIKFENFYNIKVKNLILLDPTSIYRKKKNITDAIKIFNKKKPDLLISVFPSHHDPYFSILERKGKYYSMCKSSNKIIGSRQKSKPVYNISTVVWIYSRKSIMKEKTRIPKKTLIFQLTEDESLELNTIDDINKVKKFIKYG